MILHKFHKARHGGVIDTENDVKKSVIKFASKVDRYQN